MANKSRYDLMYRPARGRKHSRRIKTSLSHPLRVDVLPTELEGSIGMTFVPGKRWDGFTGRWRRSLEKDLRRLREEYDTDHLVSLMEAFEYEMVGAEQLFERAQHYGINVVWHPIVDMTTPQDLPSYYELIEEIVDAASQGENVVIHCKGGIGRTGMTASCCLVYLGYDPYDAVMTVRKTREGTITRRSQVDLVWRYAKYLGH